MAEIGRYEIRREIGRGMMGVVYEAHDPVLGRDIALKVIQPALLPTEQDQQGFEQRFFAEARAAARLAHPGIVVVHDVGRDAGSGALFMALELLRGRSLDRVLAEDGALEWRQAVRVALRLAEALHHAHAQGVVHRDVKPANVMLLPGGEPKLMDFGIAKVDASHLTASGQFLGTPLYMSPEQALAHPVDGRSDLFSLGSILYEMLTGRRAFDGENVTKILFQVVSREPDPPTLAAAGLPAAVDYVIARCLSKDLARRYPDGRTLAEDLEDLLAGQVPRGRAAWQPAIPAEGTLIAPVAPALPPVLPPRAAAPAAAVPPAVAPARSRRAALGAALFLFVVAAVAIAWYATTAAPVARVVEPAAATPAPARDETPPPPAAEEPARLSFTFEHSLKSGSLQVWVDDALVLDEDVSGRVKREIAGIKFRKGQLASEMEVVPGSRRVRVRVAWDDNVKTETLRARFEPGERLRLRARLGGLAGLKKDLSLEWR